MVLWESGTTQSGSTAAGSFGLTRCISGSWCVRGIITPRLWLAPPFSQFFMVYQPADKMGGRYPKSLPAERNSSSSPYSASSARHPPSLDHSSLVQSLTTPRVLGTTAPPLHSTSSCPSAWSAPLAWYWVWMSGRVSMSRTSSCWKSRRQGRRLRRGWMY